MFQCWSGIMWQRLILDTRIIPVNIFLHIRSTQFFDSTQLQTHCHTARKIILYCRIISEIMVVLVWRCYILRKFQDDPEVTFKVTPTSTIMNRRNSDIFILWFGFRLRYFVHSSFSYTHNIVSSNSIAAPALVALVQLYTRCTIKILLSASSLAERGSHNNMLSLFSLVNLKNLKKWLRICNRPW